VTNDQPGMGEDVAARQERLEQTVEVVQKLAHDFGNILTSILGFTELALDQLHPDDLVLSHLQEVQRAAEQGARLTNQLRLFSRPRRPLVAGPTGQRTADAAVPYRATPLAAALALETNRLRPTWPAQIRLETDLPADLRPVAVELDLLTQVLSALLTNARESIATEGVVTVSAQADDLPAAACRDLFGEPVPGPCVRIAVRDTGAGLSPEARAGILRSPFFTTKVKHRGLGLALVYGVIRSHRGGFRLDSDPGRGTVVTLYLPVAEAPEQPAATAVGRAPREKVLVVDDDPLVLRTICATLERDGYAVRGVSSAAEALDAYATCPAEPFRLVLSDVRMPRMSGLDLARQLLSRDEGVKVLFMSAFVPADTFAEMLAGRTFPVLHKPFRSDGLLRAVREALGHVRPA
jgi:CheY-like chemotaxis protein